MAYANSSRSSRHYRGTRRRKAAGWKLAFIALTGVVAFAAGFILLWSLGSWIVGGGGFPWRSHGEVVEGPASLTVVSEYELEPLVDLLEFRDLSYVPVKGIYVTSYSASDSGRMSKLLSLADSTEINGFVVDVKDDLGMVTYLADVPMAKDLGLVENRIKDIGGLIATLNEHNIVPIARVVCFKDTSLAQAKPDLAVRSSKGASGRIGTVSTT